MVVDRLWLDLSVLHLHLVAREHDGDVLAHADHVAVPVGHALVRLPRRYVEHDDAALPLDAALRRAGCVCVCVCVCVIIRLDSWEFVVCVCGRKGGVWGCVERVKECMLEVEIEVDGEVVVVFNPLFDLSITINI